MLNEKEIAVRLFESQKYGSTYGKALYRPALFNATAQVKSPQVKYLLDFEKFDTWQHSAKNDDDMEIVHHISDTQSAGVLASWVQHYDAVTKKKTKVTGFATLNLETGDLTLLINDAIGGVEQTWKLTAKPCKSTSGKNSPQMLATNCETLSDWQ